MTWRLEDPQGNESGKVCWDIVPYTRGKGLDLGCGPSKAFPHFTGVDNCKDVELFGVQFTPDIVVEDCSCLDQLTDGSQDFVFSSHLLEHISDYRSALKEWWRVIRNDGYLVLYLPHKHLYPNVGTPGANPDHKHDFEPADIKDAMRDVVDGGWDLKVQEVRDEGREYSFLMVFQKRADNFRMSSYLFAYRKANVKTACVVRYGGFGDMIQTASILPALKRDGYHVTVMCTPRGQSVLQNDPNVDAFYIQDDDQVPNHRLLEFWEHHAKKYDKFINLSESVEGTLLAMPGRANHFWPQAIRHELMNRNYNEWTAKLAGVEFKPEGRFYPSDDERKTVGKLLDGDKFNIVYALSGSSQHKFYAAQDAVIARLLLLIPEAQIFLTGDVPCKLLEQGWEKEPRVSLLCGEQSIRETLTLAKMADLVLGPETGVLNSVAFEDDVAKVVLLSHSSVENLTKNWFNTTAIEPVDTDCYPCHQLHYGMKYCREHKETGTAMCQVSIEPERVVNPIIKAYREWKEVRRESA